MSVAANQAGCGFDIVADVPQTEAMQMKCDSSACYESDLDFYSDKTQLLSRGNNLDDTPDVKINPLYGGKMPVIHGVSSIPMNYMIDPKDLELTNEILFSIRQKIHDRTESGLDFHCFQQKQEDQYESVQVKLEEDMDDLLDTDLNPYNLLQAPNSESAFRNSDSSSFVFSEVSKDTTDLSYISSDFTSSNECSVMSSVCQSSDPESKGSQFSSSSLDNSGFVKNSCFNVESTCDSAVTSPGEKTSLKPSNHLLPPCRVCGDKASGFHYGANTCEACKGFFRRSLKKDKREYKCPSDENCVIQKGRRTNCPLCRYNKCLAVGMSKNAIKTGRYTHEKRTKDILEVNTLQGKPGPHFLQPSFLKTDWSSKTRPKRSLSANNKQLLDTIYSAHKLIFPLWHKTLVTGQHKILSKQYIEKYNMEKTARINSPGSTGTQSDNSNSPKIKDEKENSEAIDVITKHLEIAIMAFVRYAKAVPGFMDLPLNDQATLVKKSRFEIWMVSAHKLIDVELQVVTGPRGKSYHMDELSEILDEGYIRSLFNFAQSMQEINLSLEETAMLKCVVLTFSDRGDLQESQKVEAIQLMLVNCLEEMIDNGARFARVINSLIRLRDLTEWNNRISENVVLEWPTVRRHPLLVEILSV